MRKIGLSEQEGEKNLKRHNNDQTALFDDQKGVTMTKIGVQSIVWRLVLLLLSSTSTDWSSEIRDAAFKHLFHARTIGVQNSSLSRHPPTYTIIIFLGNII